MADGRDEGGECMKNPPAFQSISFMKTLRHLLHSFCWLALASCSALQGPPSPELFKRQLAITSILQKHSLPATSNQAARHADSEINMAVAHVRAVSLSQGLVFDGSRVSEGIVIVGRHSAVSPILLGLQFYRVPDGRIAYTDVTYSSGNNFSETQAMKSRLLRAL